MNASGLLMRARWRALTHYLSQNSPTKRPGPWLAGLALIVGLLVLGHLKAPALLEPLQDSATPQGLAPKSALVAGGAALEIAFWLTALMSAVSAFRVMELLFRRKDIRAIQSLPLPMSAYFIDRLVVGLFEAIGLSLLCALPFAPLLWRGAPLVSVVCALMPLLGLIATLCIGFGVQLWAGASEYDEREGGTSQTGGQLFLYAPGAALAGAVVVDLIIKLGLGEWLRTGSFARPTQLTLGVASAVGAVCVVMGYRYAQRSYLRMLAGFREADFMSVNVELHYQDSAFMRESALSARIPEPIRSIFKRHKLQYGRRYMLSRTMYPIFWLIYGLGLWTLSREALPVWALIAGPWVVLAALINPWSRLEREGISAPRSLCLPVSAAQEDAATALFVVRELALFIAPLCAIILAVSFIKGELTLGAQWAGMVGVGAVGMAGACGATRRLLGPGSIKMLATALLSAAALSALLLTHMGLALGLALVLCVVLIGVLFGHASANQQVTT